MFIDNATFTKLSLVNVVLKRIDMPLLKVKRKLTF